MPDSTVHLSLGIRIPMRDGVMLAGDLYRPAPTGRFPTLLCRTPYDKLQDRYVNWAWQFAQRGYAVVLQDCRGRYNSDGDWAAYVCEAEDGYDTQQWIGTQPWCDGQIGMFGISYVGFTQILPAPYRSPYVKALVPTANQQDNYGHIYSDGVLQLQNAMNFMRIGTRTTNNPLVERMDLHGDVYRRLPLISALDPNADRPLYRGFIEHYTFDDYWKSYSMRDRYGEVDLPAYFITGWYDNLVHEMFKVFTGWKRQARSEAARARTRLLVGPWWHPQLGNPAPFGDISFGSAAAVDMVEEQLRWFDQRLRGVDTGIDRQGAIRLFVMGENVWREEAEWPLARTTYVPYYLHSGGRANSGFGDGRLSQEPPGDAPADTFTYDPADPVPTHGGHNQFVENTGPRDRRQLERRDDVLVYTTEPLAAPVEITGPITLHLYAASSAPDTDFTAALIDVHPNGQAILLSDGIVRARFRESIEQPTLIEPGRAYAYRITIWETSNLFLAGHRIRLEVSSSNFPRYDRNLNTGHRPGMDAELRLAEQTILHDVAHPSHLLLPVIPR